MMSKEAYQSAKFLFQLFDSIPSMLFIVDAEVRVVHLNAAAKKLHGDDSFVFMGSGGKILNCIHAKGVQAECGMMPHCTHCVIRKAVGEAARGGKIFRESAKMEIVDDCTSREVHMMVTASPFQYESKPHILLIMEDISELKQTEEKLKGLNELLEKQAATDPLTGIYNRLRFNEFLVRDIDDSRRYEYPLSVIIFDIDHFKKINDRFGHHAGDRVLKDVVAIIAANIRKADVFARWGGDEFMVLSTHTDLDSTRLLAEKLRSAVADHVFPGAHLITCSFGVTQIQAADTVESFTARADQALYAAKNAGRNRVATV